MAASEAGLTLQASCRHLYTASSPRSPCPTLYARRAASSAASSALQTGVTTMMLNTEMPQDQAKIHQHPCRQPRLTISPGAA
jgi:hypothetical protein